ncbi:hypothetical protein SAMN04488103_10441 [Gemmobacter aquatilis]|uniref:Uncharacterized protein n=1 Tax=Gemmobacter aquatilis TaxID=933059 RepID=A0A1H8F3J3_9RHOB|nr:hypothetical protein [Gemmobacter aquatilis]SEN25687.1 hypothetical protein SAMN04488103_10441 [Gemmobacter aquatilis]
MSSKMRIAFALCTIAVLAACAGPKEEVIVTDPAVSVEPTYTGKL